MTEWWQVPHGQFQQAKVEQTERMRQVFESNQAAKLVLEKVLEWYGGFEDDNLEWEIRLEDYLPFSGIELDQVINGRRILALSVSSGDEGGPASVYSFFDGDEDGQWWLELILQEFDTGWSLIWGGEYASGKVGFIHQDIQVDRQEAQTTKLGLQEYSEEEQKLMEKRPVVV
jgi:hypothetical protein